MTKCFSCNQEMLLVDSCTDRTVVYPDGLELPLSTDHFNEPNGRCHDCNALHGKYHHSRCDVERCPRCGGQLITCGCLNEQENR